MCLKWWLLGVSFVFLCGGMSAQGKWMQTARQKPPTAHKTAAKRKGPRMADNISLVWTASEKHRAGTEEYAFFLDKTGGLRDMDFQPLTDANWHAMQSPNAATTAALMVTPDTTLETIERAVTQLKTKGHYHSVQIFSHRP